MTRFGQHTPGREVVETFKSSIEGKTIVLTGASEGTIGGQAVLDLAVANPARLFLIGRSIGKIQPVIDQFKQENKTTEVIFVKADLDDLDTIRKAADEIKSKTDKLDYMFNNAGVMCTPWKLTKQGHEWQFGINHLSHFVLTARLWSLIEAAAPGVKIVNTSSTGCELADVPFNDITWGNGTTYHPWKSYGASKTANALFGVELVHRHGSKGISAFAVQPGIPPSHLQDDMPKEGPRSFRGGVQIYAETHPGQTKDASQDMKSLEAATSTMFAAALDPDLAPYSGRFLQNCDVYVPDPHVLDPEGARKLWKLSEELTGETF